MAFPSFDPSAALQTLYFVAPDDHRFPMLIGIPVGHVDSPEARRPLTQAELSDIHETLRQSAPDDLKPPPPMPLDQVRTESRQLSRSTFENWEAIRLIIERYESIIHKRWFKRTREQRRRVLLAAWPHMLPHHRPDLEAFRREKAPGPAGFVDPYLWPYINQEDLLKSKLFLIFLNARGRNPPSAFTGADADSTSFGRAMEKLEVSYLFAYSLMFAGRDTPETYGELVSWGDRETTFSKTHTPLGMTPDLGLQVLQVQDRIYRFLRDCCGDRKSVV